MQQQVEPFKARLAPTEAAYDELQQAYQYFNRVLFDGDLPPLLLTLQRKEQRVRGYYSPNRFAKASHDQFVDVLQTTDELALNPQHFGGDPLVVLSTLVHEMAHVWRRRVECSPGRMGYHDLKWGTKMKTIGLHPSNTGAPGGRETGYQMNHFIVEGGPFHLAASRLIDEGFSFSWADRVKKGQSPTPQASLNGNRSNRLRFVCPTCFGKAWAKPAMQLMCGACTQLMVAGD
jgi:hypothetical protein